jgi:hypothetical protein
VLKNHDCRDFPLGLQKRSVEYMLLNTKIYHVKALTWKVPAEEKLWEDRDRWRGLVAI